MNRLAFLLVLGVICACDSKKESTGTTPAWKDDSQAKPIGPNYEDQDFVLSAQAPRFCETSGPMAPDEGQQRLSVSVKVRSLTTREVQVAPLLFTVEDREGHQFRATLADCGPRFPRKQLKEGETAEGEIPFDVPAGFVANELIYEPFLIGRKKVTARISLSPTVTPTKSEKPPQEEAAPSD